MRWKPGPPELYVMPDSTSVESLIEGDDGELLIGTGNGIKRLVGDKVEAYPLPGIEQLKPNSMLRDRDGGLWIGTEDRGLLHLHRGRADVFTQSDGLSGNYVTNLFEDREHNVWVSTLTGLDKFRDLPSTQFLSSRVCRMIPSCRFWRPRMAACGLALVMA